MIIITAGYVGKLQQQLLIFGHKIECSDERATGTRVDVHFTEEAYKPVIEEHL
jgi:hypothetical protein